LFTAIRHFSTTWTHESAQTARLLADLTDASLGQRIAEGYRSLGELAWHVVVSPRTIMRHAGLEFDAPDKTAPMPSRAGEILSTYVDTAKGFLRAVQQSWTDDDLREKIDFYGSRVSRGVALAVTLHHEIHHRGQITVLMRQAGLKVRGMYGPAKGEDV
jgi:uncharacterized damage-inducible protein DinB